MIDHNEAMTLDPPGRIAVIGAGPLGLEAALYGRFLGYDVTVFEQGAVGETLRPLSDRPLPMLPSHCLSPLAWSAISAQSGSAESGPPAALPLTVGQWLDRGLEPLARTDLLRGRIRTGHQVVGIEAIDVDVQGEPQAAALEDAAGDADEYYIDGHVAPDFRLTVRVAEGSAEGGSPAEQPDFEAVIAAIGAADAAAIEGMSRCESSPYCFRLGGLPAAGVPEDQALQQGLQQIVRIFASLAGREGLDLYRPVRM